jgi:uncharacterized protein (TIGR02246 family)
MATKTQAIEENQIRELVDNWGKAVRAKDLNSLMANYAPDVLSFDVLPPLKEEGLDTARQRAENWISSFKGPIGYETRDLQITVGNDVAFCHCINQVSGTKADGGKVEMPVRATICFRKIDGKWLVTHQHISVPVEMK